MKFIGLLLLFFFSFLVIQPMVDWIRPVSEESVCTRSCCIHKEQKKAPKPKGMCGDMSCNPFGQYACCTGFIVTDKSPVVFNRVKLREYSIPYNQAYIYLFTSNCWQPPENTDCLLG